MRPAAGRAGEGEYRLNGARCRLVDVIEVLSDSGLGKEMHSVVSQGKVEPIVMSRPRERRLLIEEAAGLGKHRKRRRRAQLKLERTEENLSRALDVEREARSRLRPLKRQAEAAELPRAARAPDARGALRALAGRSTRRPGGPCARRRSVRSRHVPSATRPSACSPRWRGGASRPRRPSRPSRAPASGCRRAFTRRAPRPTGSPCGSSASASRPPRRPSGASAGCASSSCSSSRRRRTPSWPRARRARSCGSKRSRRSLPSSTRDGRSASARELAGLEEQLASARAEVATIEEAAAGRRAALAEAEDAAAGARTARRDAERTAEAARAAAARVGSELAAVNQFVRGAASLQGDARPFAESLHVEPGYELALAAVLGPRLTAGVVPDLAAGERLLDGAGRDGGSALLGSEWSVPSISLTEVADSRRAAREPRPPGAGGRRAGRAAAERRRGGRLARHHPRFFSWHCGHQDGPRL